MSPFAGAAIIGVTTTADELAANGECSLREAIQAANTDSAVDSCAAGDGDDTIDLPAGTYLLGIAGANEDGNETGDLDINDDVTIVGSGSAACIIDAAGLDRALHVDPAATGVIARIAGVTIQNGRAAPQGIGSQGGGILNLGDLTLDHVVLRNSTGSALDVAGAGLYNLGTLLLEDSTVSGNGSLNQGVAGAGIGNAGGARATIRRTTLDGNLTGSFGGGIDSRGVLTLENSTVARNIGFYGGGVLNNIGGRMTIINCTIAENRGGFGGGILNNSQVEVRASIIAKNNADGAGPNCLGGITSGGHNLDGDGSCSLAAPGDISNADPLLGPLADNGGPTATYALLDSSPAVDAGPATGCTDRDGAPLLSDQRGVARPLDGNGDGSATCDLGALEVQPPNEAPSADAGPDQIAECGSPEGSMVALSGAGSTDADSTPGTADDIISYEWYEDFGLPTERLLGSGMSLQALLGLGPHDVTLRVTDHGALSDTDSLSIEVIDTTAPALGVALSPDLLWPPSHRMIQVSAEVSATDACGTAEVRLLSITSSEASDATGEGDGHTTHDIEGADMGTPDFDFGLRAERDGCGPGRTYAVTYTATDDGGNTSTAITRVLVPLGLGAGGPGCRAHTSPPAGQPAGAKTNDPDRDPRSRGQAGRPASPRVPS